MKKKESNLEEKELYLKVNDSKENHKRLKEEEILSLFKTKSLTWIDGVYINNTTKLTFINQEGYKLYTSYMKLKQNKASSPFHTSNPFTLENINFFMTKNDIDLTLCSDSYEGSNSNLKFTCNKCHKKLKITWHNLLRGDRCSSCSRKISGKKRRIFLDIKEMNNELRDKNIEVLSKEYRGTDFFYEFNCLECKNKWERTWTRMSKNKTCPFCNKNKQKIKRDRKKVPDGFGQIYVINCYNENENFYKIGKTKKALNKRFSSKKDMPYNYKIELIKQFPLLKSIEIEKRIHSFFTEDSYLPKIYFAGYTECYSQIEEIKEYLEFLCHEESVNLKTHCLLEFKNEKVNLNTLNTERTIFLLIDLKSQFDSACSLDLVDEVNYNGYNIRDWMTDVKLKLAHLSEMKKKAKLKQMESKLDALLSEGTKVKIELDEIEKMVKGE